MSAESKIRDLFALADIEIDGKRPWDIQVHDQRLYGRIFAQGSLGLGEAYIDGWWDCKALDMFAYFVIQARLEEKILPSPQVLWLAFKSRILNRQDRRGAREAAEVHYDLSPELFKVTYCDDRITGSCAYWANGAQDINEAQDAKLDLVCRKLGLKPGQRILDIGCGWGAFMGYAAEHYEVECVGVTISKEQAAYANERYAGRLPVQAFVMDYRDVEGEFDHIASMGMFEHVGPKNYREYFETARRCLKDDGLFMLHTIWNNSPVPHTEPFIDKYIFPNGALPTVGLIGTAVHDLFVVEDVHNFGLYYDQTLMAWYRTFNLYRERVKKDLGLDERFCRMWEYYLLTCAGGFRSRSISVGQFILSPHGVTGDVYESVR